MRLRHITGSEDFVANSPFVASDPAQYRGRWRELLGAGHPLHIEIGMGKGQFITELAREHPDISYIGIERYDTVLMKAIHKREKMEEETGKITNLIFVSMDARLLTEIFTEGEADRIYLNFSDPWPKKRQANRRLTSPVFLRIYETILSPTGDLWFKTDNEGLFDYSLESVPASGWCLTSVTRDLHHDPALNEGNIMTEYEAKFSARGNPIFQLKAIPPEKKKNSLPSA